jgi:hypothetical protein
MNAPLRKDDLLRRDDDPSREPERIEGEHERIHRELSSDSPGPVEVSEESENDLDRPAVSDRPGPQSADKPEPRRTPVSIEARRTPPQEGLREDIDGDRGSMGELQSRWSELQTIFVDDPRSAVQRADEVVSQTIQRIHERMNTQRSQLGERWQRDDNISTEDLRVAFQNYRNFFRSLVENPVK